MMPFDQTLGAATRIQLATEENTQRHKDVVDGCQDHDASNNLSLESAWEFRYGAAVVD